MDRALAWAVDALIARLAAGGVSPSLLLCLLAAFISEGRDDLRTPIEGALALALERFDEERHPLERCDWLSALAEASTISDDDRIAQTVQTGLPSVIDDLERFVAHRYEPGEGLEGETVAGQVSGAASLLSAFEMTGRLPYSMLAEELLQSTYRRWWVSTSGAFDADFRTNCRAVQVLCRLATLHRDVEYATAAVVAERADYGSTAARVLEWLDRQYREHPADADEYGVALQRWFAFKALPN